MTESRYRKVCYLVMLLLLLSFIGWLHSRSLDRFTNIHEVSRVELEDTQILPTAELCAQFQLELHNFFRIPQKTISVPSRQQGHSIWNHQIFRKVPTWPSLIFFLFLSDVTLIIAKRKNSKFQVRTSFRSPVAACESWDVRTCFS